MRIVRREPEWEITSYYADDMIHFLLKRLTGSDRYYKLVDRESIPIFESQSYMKEKMEIAVSILERKRDLIIKIEKLAKEVLADGTVEGEV